MYQKGMPLRSTNAKGTPLCHRSKVVHADANKKRIHHNRPTVSICTKIMCSFATKPKPKQYITTAHDEHESTKKNSCLQNYQRKNALNQDTQKNLP